MEFIYNVILYLVEHFIKVMNSTGMTKLMSEESKTRKFFLEQATAIERVKEIPANPSIETIWVHASSLGEYGVARPIIRRLKEERRCRVVLTFFSPTGYLAVTGMRDSYSEADYIMILPLDTSTNAKVLIDAVRPGRAIFVISELWPNYMSELRRQGIATFLVSALITRRSSSTKWYGGLLRDTLRKFTRIMVLDSISEHNLREMGISNVSVTGDPLFDNAVAVANQSYRNEIIERFCGQDKVFIAGSISDGKDLDIVSYVANANRKQKFIFVPHEIYEEGLNEIIASIERKSLLYSECSADTDFSDVQVLIIDFMGALSKIYRYCRYAYVGGGFTPYLHNIIEATVYGLPVAFGPKIYRKNTPSEMVALGIGKVVRNGRELDRWFKSIKYDEIALDSMRKKAVNYTLDNSGATDEVIKIITS